MESVFSLSLSPAPSVSTTEFPKFTGEAIFRLDNVKLLTIQILILLHSSP